MRGADVTLEELPALIPMRSNVEIPVLVCFYPELVERDSPCLFLANGFSANEKTWSFRPLIGEGKFGMSIMEHLAAQGFVVVVKNVGSERTTLEPNFGAHSAHVPQLVAGVAKRVPEIITSHTGKRYGPPGVHWVGHSLGGMEVMPVKNRRNMLSFTAIASPTYMGPYDLFTRLVAVLMGRVIGLHYHQLHLNIPVELVGRIADQFFKALRVQSGHKLNHDQQLLVGMLMHMPGFHIISNVFLNLDHLDLETTVAFFRAALSDETVYLMVEFAEHALRGENGHGEVLGRDIAPLRIPTLIIAGGGDNIAPPQSCEDLIQYVKHPRRYAFTFDEYDHVGLLVQHSAQYEIWPVISTFILESNAAKLGNKTTIRKVIRKIRSIASDENLGSKSRGFARDSCRRMEKMLEKRSM